MFMDIKNGLRVAREKRFAIGAFNVFDLESVKAVCLGASELHSPVIIQITPKAIEYAGLRQIFDIVRDEILVNNIKTTVHLDHGRDFTIVKQCIDMGFNSVMIDGSYYDFDSNVSITKKVVNYAKEYGVQVEGEIGAIGKEIGEAGSNIKNQTDPTLVSKFIEATGIDSVAVSVGNRHGAPEGEKIDFELLSTISKISTIPIVMHGSSGLSKQDIENATQLGVCKFNIDTNLKRAFTRQIAETDGSDPRKIMTEVIESMKEVVLKYIKIFGSEGRAGEV